MYSDIYAALQDLLKYAETQGWVTKPNKFSVHGSRAYDDGNKDSFSVVTEADYVEFCFSNNSIGIQVFKLRQDRDFNEIADVIHTRLT